MLDSQQNRWIEDACKRIDPNRLTEIVRMMVDVASPTGEEGALARRIAADLREAGLKGQEQMIDSQQSNAIGEISGSGEGPSLLLYAPIDTVTSSNAEEDLPWAGNTLREDMLAKSKVDGDSVIGLGAQNPKGHAACVFAAAEAIRSAGVPLRGNLQLGFGAGGMPTHARKGTRADSGHGAGCAFMLQQGPRPDFAIIAKSGWAVSWEEVGLAWFEVRVKGTHSYVGSRHLLPFTNPIVDAAAVIRRLEAWFPEWTEQHRTGLVAPQGVVSFIESGWERMPAFTPAECRFIVDLRLSPRTSPDQASQSFGEKLAQIATELEVELEWARVAAIPGTITQADSWIIQAAIAAWEIIEGHSHQPIVGMSGATDANILREGGVPTARIGLPKVNLPNLDFQLGMNTVSVRDMQRLTRHLIHVAVSTCTRSREEVVDE